MNDANQSPRRGSVDSSSPRVSSSPEPRARARRLVPTVIWSLAVVSALAALVRIGSVLYALSLGELPADHFEAHYVENLRVVMLHLVPAVAFVLLGPLQFSTRFRRRGIAGPVGSSCSRDCRRACRRCG